MSPSMGEDTMVVMTGAGVAARILGEQVVAEQHAHLVAGELHERAAFVFDRDGEPIGVGIVGEDEVGAGPAGERDREIHRAVLFGVGEAHGGERRGRARVCSGTLLTAEKPAASSARAARANPTPCIGVYTMRSGGPNLPRREAARTIASR